MKRFLIETERETIEGIQFSDGTYVLHGGAFQACQFAELPSGSHPQWLDDDSGIEWTPEQIDMLQARWNALVDAHGGTLTVITTVDALRKLRTLGLVQERELTA